MIYIVFPVCFLLSIFFFNDTATTEIYTLSLHDALPIYARLDPHGVGRLEQLRPDAERPLASERLLQPGTHGRAHRDEGPAADVPRRSAHRLVEALVDVERAPDHPGRFRRGVELPDDADGTPGPAGSDELALQHEHVAHAAPGQVERDGRAGDAASDDDDVGAAGHLGVAASAADASLSERRRTGSPRRTAPSTRTR